MYLLPSGTWPFFSIATDLAAMDGMAHAYLPDSIWSKWTHKIALFALKIRGRCLKTKLSDPDKKYASGGKKSQMSHDPVPSFLKLSLHLNGLSQKAFMCNWVLPGAKGEAGWVLKPGRRQAAQLQLWTSSNNMAVPSPWVGGAHGP